MTPLHFMLLMDETRGYISPVLFNAYMDELSLLLNTAVLGSIGEKTINHLC